MIDTEKALYDIFSKEISNFIKYGVKAYIEMTPEQREIHDTKLRLELAEKEESEYGYEDQWGVYHKGGLPNCEQLYYEKRK